MKFEEVARVIGSELPASAYKHRPWWANESAGHVHAKAWLAAGYEATQVDMEGHKLVFKRIVLRPEPAAIVAKYGGVGEPPSGMAEERREFKPADAGKQPRRSPLFGALKGTFTIEPGYDLTSPSMDADELAEWEASLDRKADLYEKGLPGKKT